MQLDPQQPEPPTTAAGAFALPHTLGVEETLLALQTGRGGLSDSEAAARLSKHGPNRLPEPPRRGPLVRFLAHFHNVLIYVLLGAALITATLGHVTDTAVIVAVVVANAIIGFVQEGRAEQAMGAIRQMLSPRTAVLRDGRRESIDSEEVVRGDVVLLEAGDRVPADLRLLEVAGLRIEEAVLTGESAPVEKSVSAVDPDTPLGDRGCMAFSGTLIAGGTGLGVVVGTGADTEIGRISGMLSRVETIDTPLIRQMDRFARWLTAVILVTAGALLVYGHFRGHLPFAELFMAVVGLAVAAIPEGLPAVLTITLAVGVRTMAQLNAIVRRLPAIETLGSVSVICTDKTGTLTRNEMMVAAIASADQTFSVSGTGYVPEGSIRLDDAVVEPAEHELLVELARAATLCNDAALHYHPDGWRMEGDPMEGALHALAGKIMADGPHAFSEWTRTDVIPFDASVRYMATLHHDHHGHAEIHTKGAPERILSMCAGQRTADGGEAPLESDYWERQVKALAEQGQRVLAFAVRQVDEDHVALNVADIDGRMVLLGLTGLIDPPRSEAIDAVAECHGAGIRVKMVTGDHAVTATAIARQIGLEHPQTVLTGADLDKMDANKVAVAVLETDVFARTSPEHKLRLVSALQSRGLTVAMTGDGVNDAPALKRADAGVAMGRKGSEAAKEAAEVVLADDNFASIVAAVREGRTVYDNIKKVISWTLPTSSGEAMTIVVALFLGLALPVTALQILWVNLVTTVTLGLALAFEPTEPGTMRRPPRQRHEPLLSASLVWHVLFVSGLFLVAVFGMFFYATERRYGLPLAQTMALNMLVVLEIFHLFFIRNIHGQSLSFRSLRATPIVWVCVAAIVAAQVVVTVLPPLQRVFGTVTMSVADALSLIAVGVVFFAVLEGEKRLRSVLSKAWR